MIKLNLFASLPDASIDSATTEETFENNPVSFTVPFWKRVLDVAIILMVLPVVLPLMVVIATAIWVGSDGPILFRQERVGYRGRRFICYKFRTMFVGNSVVTHEKHLAELITSNAPMTKMDATGDKRIIPGGRWLRSSGLDELPQLINVLLDEMSIVGPRPCLPYEFENYLAWQKERFNALPGITGLWQISGKNKTTFAEMIRLDIRYARNQGLAQDVVILCKTLPVLVGQVRELGLCRRPQ